MGMRQLKTQVKPYILEQNCNLFVQSNPMNLRWMLVDILVILALQLEQF
jgi:hypothetical protein